MNTIIFRAGLCLLLSAVGGKLMAREATPPHALFTPAELPAIRARLEEQDVPRAAWQELLRRSEAHVTAEELQADRSLTPRDALVELGLAWQLSGEERFGARLAREVARLREADADLGEVRYDWGLVYDLGNQAMSAACRVWLRAWLLEETARRQERVVAFSRNNPGLRVSNLDVPKFVPAARFGAALAGDPDFKEAWLDLAAEEFRRYFTESIGRDGDYIEHATYWFFGMVLGGDITAYMLHRKGHDLVTGTHLPQLPEWLLYHTVPPVYRTLDIADANLQGYSPTNLRLLLTLMPDNPALNLLAARVADEVPGRGGSTVDLIAALLFHREPKAVEIGDLELPRARHFRDHNMAHFRGDWGRDALAAFIAARWEWGHIHDDIGAFTLWSHGRYWAVDSGYGIPASEAHNLVLVDGKGMPRRAAGGEMPQFFHSPLASLAETDARRSWSESLAGHFDWLTSNVVDSMALATRLFTVVWDDETVGAAPYVLVLDDIQKDRETRRYEWIMGTWPDHILELGENRATLTTPLDNRWLQGPGTPREGTAAAHWFEQRVAIAAAGDYDAWVFVRGDDDWGGAYANAWIDGQRAGYMPLGGPTWQWRKVSRQTLPLEPGEVTVRINQNAGQPLRFKWLALSRDPEFSPYEPRLYADEHTISVELGEETELRGEWQWVEAAEPGPALEVAFLQPEVTLRQDWFLEKGRWHHQRHPRLRAEAEAVNPRFLALLYPRAGNDAPLDWRTENRRYGYPYTVHWPGGVDYLGDRGTRRGAFGTDGQLMLVRFPTSEDAPPPGTYARATPLPETTAYLLVNGTSLHFEGVDLVSCDLGRFGSYVTVACRGGELIVNALTAPGAQWQLERNGTLRAWGPRISRVVVNGVETAFERDGDHVEVAIRTQVFTPTRDRVTRRMQRRYDEIHPPQ